MKKSKSAILVSLLAVSLFVSGTTVLADTIENTQAPENTETTEITENPEEVIPKFTVKEYQTSKSKYVTASKITKYAEPTTKSEKKGTVAFGKKIKVVGEVTEYDGKTLKTKWYQLDSGVYVSSSNLSKSKPATVTVKKYKKSKTRYAKSKNVKVYKYPSTAKTSTVKVKLSKGTKVQVFGKVIKYRGDSFSTTKWYNCRVKVGGTSCTGYIHRDNLTTTKPKNSSSSGNHNNSVPDNFGDMDKASDHRDNIQG